MESSEIFRQFDPDLHPLGHALVSELLDEGTYMPPVVEPETGIITAATLTPASGPQNSDAAVGIDLLAAPGTGLERFEVLGDSAYGSGDMLAALAQPGIGQ